MKNTLGKVGSGSSRDPLVAVQIGKGFRLSTPKDIDWWFLLDVIDVIHHFSLTTSQHNIAVRQCYAGMAKPAMPANATSDLYLAYPTKVRKSRP